MTCIDFASGQATGLDKLTLGNVALPGRYKFSLQATSTAEQLVVSGIPADLAIPASYTGLERHKAARSTSATRRLPSPRRATLPAISRPLPRR